MSDLGPDCDTNDHEEIGAGDLAEFWEELARELNVQLTAMTEQWRKTNGEYERVSKALCRVQRQLTEAQQEIKQLREACMQVTDTRGDVLRLYQVVQEALAGTKEG